MNLFNKVFDAKLSLLGESIVSPLKNSDLSVLDRIKGAIEDHFEFMRKNPDLAHFVVTEMISRLERRHIIIDKIMEIATPYMDGNMNWMRRWKKV
ncbi:MAG: hypothetical protein RR550_01385 [Rikenellaceae bacterium]